MSQKSCKFEYDNGTEYKQCLLERGNCIGSECECYESEKE